jgi:hypothetical protein
MYRDGAPIQNPTASVLTGAFFVVMGVAVGVTVASLLAGRRTIVSVGWPVILSALTTLGMYVGESILLGGTLYRFGTSWFFTGLSGLVVAPVDIGIILLTTLLTAESASWLRRSTGSIRAECST